ncbi:MAG: hypothetical protein IT436_02475 [Phycisphaerales bacterium]|nr:hypothetical protein [Phycisphaerales bacterium]
MPQPTTPPTAPSPSTPPHRKRRAWLWALGAIAIILGLAILLLPTIASSVAPGLVESKANARLTGSVKLDRVSLSWFGPQKVGPVTLFDDASKPIAKLDVQASPGLLGLVSGAMSGSLDIGTIRLAGNADIIRRKDGSTNLQAALTPRGGAPAQPSTSPAPSGPKQGGSLPKGLNARAVIDNFDITVTDETQPAGSPAHDVWLTGLKGEAAISTGGPVVAKLDGAVGAGKGAGAATGSLKVDATINNLSDAAGNLTLDKAGFNINLNATGIPVALADALAGQGGKLITGLGDTLEAKVIASGDMNNGTADLSITTPRASAIGTLAMADKSISTSKPLEIKAQGAAIKALAPALDQSLAKSGLTLATMPDVSASVENLKIKLPQGGKLDLRGSSATVTLKTTQASGTLKLPAPEGQQAETKAFALAPLQARIESADLAGPVRLTAATSATLGGQPAGTLSADLTAAGLLDGAGAPIAGPPRSLQGGIAIRGITTAIAQPFVAGMGLDVPADLGPTLDMTLDASSNLADAKPGALPATDLDLAFASSKLNAKGGFRISQTALQSRGGDFTLRLEPAGQLISRFVKPDTGFRFDPAGSVLFVLKNLDIPLTADRKPQLDRASGRIELWTGNLRIAPVTPGTPAVPPLDIPELNVMTSLAAGKPPHVEMAGKLRQDQADFKLAGQLDLLGAFDALQPGAKPLPPNTLPVRPSGRLDVVSVPTSLVRMVMVPKPGAPSAQPGQPAANPLDVAGLVRDVVGPTVNIRLLTTADPARPDALTADLSIAGERLEALGKAALTSTKADFSSISAKTTLSAATLDTLLATFAPTIKDRPRLTGNATALLAVDPISIPLKPGFQPDLASAGKAGLRLTLPGQTLLEGLRIPGAEGQPPRDLGPMGVEDFQIGATTTVAALMGTTPQRAEATLSGKLLSGPKDRLMSLSGGGATELTGGKPTGPITANLKIEQGRTTGIDKILAQPGLLSGALGESLGADLSVVLGPPAASGERSINAEANIRAPRVSMDQPVKVSVLADRITVDQPTKINWQLDSAWANQYLFKPDPKTGKPPLRLTQDAGVRLTINQAAIARGAGAGPFKPGIFKAALSAEVPAAAMELSTGERVALDGVRVNLNSVPPGAGATGESLKFDLLVAGASVGDAPKAANLGVQGRVDNIATPAGQFSTETAQLTADGNVPALPTAIVDALARQEGLLVDALGPVVQATLSADHFGMNSGTLAFNARSERAEAGVKGRVENKVFILEQPLNVTIVEITSALSARVVRALPSVGQVQKSRKDAPAVVRSTDLRVPLDGDLSKLNGAVTVDPGEASFASSSEFAKFLKIISMRPDRQIGRKLQPLNIAFNSGVATYQEWELPLGEFNVKSRGTIDLVGKNVDVITYIPAGALTGEVVGVFGGAIGKIPGVGQIITDATMLPFRTRGTFEKQKTEPDLELFAKEFVGQIRPDKIIEKGLEDLFKKKQDGPK